MLLNKTETETVARVDEGEVDALVIPQLLVQPPDGHGVLCVVFGVEDTAIPQGVIKCHHTTTPHQHQTQLEVAAIVGLVGVHEGEVEGASLPLVYEPLQGVCRGGNVQLDLVTHAGLLPVLLACMVEDKSNNTIIIYYTYTS